jgi:hypothetical protein
VPFRDSGQNWPFVPGLFLLPTLYHTASGFPHICATVFVMPTEHQKSREWVAAHAKRIGKTVAKLRGERSGLWLSNETAKAGHRISRTSIHDLEKDEDTRKFVSTAELSVLAWALKVPPIRLLYPDLPDGLVEIVPGEYVTSIEAAMWFCGELVFDNENLELAKGAQRVKLSRRRAQLQERNEDLLQAVERSGKTAAKDRVPQPILDDIAAHQREIAEINDELRRLDIEEAAG